jgi:C-terminal processing protease CtpA/Prc
MKDTRALILDVRLNGGGDEEAARKVAGRFVERAAVYSRDRIREDGQWKGPFDRVVEPRNDARRYTKPVVVLIGPKVVSSAESFLLMMQYGARATLIGQATRGSSGRPVPHDLGNGVVVYLSSWEDQLPNGTPLEDRGVEPDIDVKTTLGGLANSDALLEAALQAVKDLAKANGPKENGEVCCHERYHGHSQLLCFMRLSLNRGVDVGRP